MFQLEHILWSLSCWLFLKMFIIFVLEQKMIKQEMSLNLLQCYKIGEKKKNKLLLFENKARATQFGVYQMSVCFAKSSSSAAFFLPAL